MSLYISIELFTVKDPISGLFFHHNYVSALLNDLFGIQSRAGCMCAGPYAQYLMGIGEEVSWRGNPFVVNGQRRSEVAKSCSVLQLALLYLDALRESDGLDRTHLRRVGEYSSREMLRPGFTRVSIPYFWTDGQVRAEDVKGSKSASHYCNLVKLLFAIYLHIFLTWFCSSENSRKLYYGGNYTMVIGKPWWGFHFFFFTSLFSIHCKSASNVITIVSHRSGPSTGQVNDPLFPEQGRFLKKSLSRLFRSA